MYRQLMLVLVCLNFQAHVDAKVTKCDAIKEQCIYTILGNSDMTLEMDSICTGGYIYWHIVSPFDAPIVIKVRREGGFQVCLEFMLGTYDITDKTIYNDITTVESPKKNVPACASSKRIYGSTEQRLELRLTPTYKNFISIPYSIY